MDFDERQLYLGTFKASVADRWLSLSQADRRRHIYVIGQTGSGKTTFLNSCILQDILSGRGYPFRWNTCVRHQGRHYDLAIAPDYVFGIEQEQDDGATKRRYYFVEIDRGTMPVTRRDIRQSSIMRKVRSYTDSFERSVPTKRFGISRFQVLFIVKSDQRMADIQAAIKTSDLPSLPAGLFLFRWRDGTQAPLPFSEIWTNLKGKAMSLF